MITDQLRALFDKHRLRQLGPTYHQGVAKRRDAGGYWRGSWHWRRWWVWLSQTRQFDRFDTVGNEWRQQTGLYLRFIKFKLKLLTGTIYRFHGKRVKWNIHAGSNLDEDATWFDGHVGWEKQHDHPGGQYRTHLCRLLALATAESGAWFAQWATINEK